MKMGRLLLSIIPIMQPGIDALTLITIDFSGMVDEE